MKPADLDPQYIIWKKRIVQKKREPTILKNSRLGFIESVHENLWNFQQFPLPLAPAYVFYLF